MTSAPTQVSDDDAKAAYLKRCMDMTHGQLYAELMRVHREATNLVTQAVVEERRACAALCAESSSLAECADAIRARGET